MRRLRHDRWQEREALEAERRLREFVDEVLQEFDVVLLDLSARGGIVPVDEEHHGNIVPRELVN
ncbi:MAG: hypothetical protein ABI639_17480 [Thermoanaerobaculia bacterium]